MIRNLGRALTRPNGLVGRSMRMMSTKDESEELIFPYAFMNTDEDLVSTSSILKGMDEKQVMRHGKVLGEVSTFLDPGHSSKLHDHFKELYVYYLESLCSIDEDPARLEQMCEPLFYNRLSAGWKDLKASGATDISLLNP